MKRMTEQTEYPNDLAAIESALDRIAAQGRAGADAEFESRVLAAAMKVRAAPEDWGGGVGGGTTPPHFVITRPSTSARLGRWRLAASVALYGGSLLGLTWLASRPAFPPLSPPFSVVRGGEIDAREIASELERLLSEGGGWDAGLGAAILAIESDVKSEVGGDAEFWGTGDAQGAIFVEDTL